MLLALQRDSHTPLYTQIVVEVRRLITDGALKVGDRLPANREFAKTLGVNRNTVTTAYAELAADGLITSRVGSGTYISRVPAPATRIREHAPPSIEEAVKRLGGLMKSRLVKMKKQRAKGRTDWLRALV